MFDTDHNNNIDANEFQQLAFQLGEALTKEEVTEAIKQIDKNQDGVITFDEFYDWWSSAEHPDVREDSERAKQLRVLKMKLRSQSYMRAVSRLVEKVNQKAAAQELGTKKYPAILLFFAVISLLISFKSLLSIIFLVFLLWYFLFNYSLCYFILLGSFLPALIHIHNYILHLCYFFLNF